MIYEVKSKILKDGKEFAIGDAIELTEEEAAKMPWAVELLEDKKSAPKKGSKQAESKGIAE